MTLELRFGVRLPPPLFCPFPIALLIKECFHENASQRPSFDALRESIAQLCSELREDPKSLSGNDSCASQETVTYTDFNMKERYLQMKKQNQNIHLLNHFDANENRLLSRKATSPNTSSKEHLSYYASLENTISVIPPENVSKSWDKQFGTMKSSPRTRNEQNYFPKTDNQYRYYVTYSGENISQQRIPLQSVSFSQSCNPLYMFDPLIKPTNSLNLETTEEE